MRWISIAIVLMCVSPLTAQSLGDVARGQRDNPNRPHATRVITNNDISSGDQPQQFSPEPAPKTSARPVDRAQQADSARAAQDRRRVAELSQRVQLLQSEVNDLERQRVSARSASVYGDPNRVQKNEELRSLGEQIDSKNRELAAARTELAEAMERANKTTVLK